VLSFPIPLRLLFAAHPELLAPLLQTVHQVIATFLIKQAGLKRAEAATGAVTLIQRFGSAANLDLHLHGLVLDGVYCTTGSAPVFHPVRAPTAEQLQSLLNRIVQRLMRLLTRQGYLIEEQGMAYLADPDPETALAPLQAAGKHLPHSVRAARGAKSADLANRPEPSGAAPITTLRQRTGL
jgi:Putative transposase.